MIAPRIPAATAATPTLMRACSVAKAAARCSCPLRALGHGEAGGNGQATGVGAVDGHDGARLERQTQLLAQTLHKARDRDRGAGDDARFDRLRGLLRAIEVQRRADAV